MKTLKKIALIALILIPFKVHAYKLHISSDKYTSPTESFLQYKYKVDSLNVTCIDPDLANPDPEGYKDCRGVTLAGADLIKTTLDSSDNFGRGLIAIANYIKANGISDEINIADAYRIYTMKINPRTGGGVIGATNVDHLKNYNEPGIVNEIVKIGVAAANNEGSDYQQYIPNGSSGISEGSDGNNQSVGSTGNLTIKKDGKEEVISQNQSYVKVKANVIINGGNENILISSCSANNGFNCSYTQPSNNAFTVTVDGKVTNKSSVKVSLSFNQQSTISQEDMITKVDIYACEDFDEKCIQRFNISNGNCGKSRLINGYAQRFIEIVPGKGGANGDGKSITITIPSICDQKDMSDQEKIKNGCCDSVSESYISSLEEDSQEEENYLKACGEIVVLDNYCGATDCNGQPEKEFTHSYVRPKTMKLIMNNLESGISVEPDYKDNNMGGNNYCGVYISEKIDAYMPTTATSVSGQFFIFDKYYDESCTDEDEKSCLRQPHIIGRLKQTYFFNATSWMNQYNNLAAQEQESYNNWQNLTRAAKEAQDRLERTYKLYYIHKDNESCYECDDRDEITKVCNVCKKTWKEHTEEKYNESKDDFEKLVSQAESALNTYKSSITNRMNHQRAKEQCKTVYEKFKEEYKYEFEPEVTFKYDENTDKTSNTEEMTNVKMISNTESVKYWPNTTQDVASKAEEYFGISGPGFTKNGSSKTGVNDYTKSFNKDRGEYCSDFGDEEKKPTCETYTFPQSSVDYCKNHESGYSKCLEYKYDDLTFDSRKNVLQDSEWDYPYGDNFTLPSNSFTKATDSVSKVLMYRPNIAYYALMNSGQYKTLEYDANNKVTAINGLEVGYVYNLELTAFKGNYKTLFEMKDVGHKKSEGGGFTQKLIDKYINQKGESGLISECIYCNEEMAFRRNCPECDPSDPNSEFKPQFYYRNISLSDVTPNDRTEGETNWSDAKGKAAEVLIEQGSGNNISYNFNEGNEYIALASNLENKQSNENMEIADNTNSKGIYDIYDDASKKYLEYEFNLTMKDMQFIKKSSSKSNFDYSVMNLCKNGDENKISKDEDQYCFKCNEDMKECQSTFVSAFSVTEITNDTRKNKWKYYIGSENKFVTGKIYDLYDKYPDIFVRKDSSGKEEKRRYPDPIFVKSWLDTYKNWP